MVLQSRPPWVKRDACCAITMPQMPEIETNVPIVEVGEMRDEQETIPLADAESATVEIFFGAGGGELDFTGLQLTELDLDIGHGHWRCEPKSVQRGLGAACGGEMMKRRFIWLILLLAVGLLLFPATPALADGDPPGDGGITIWGEDYTLEKDECLDGDLVVVGGDVTLEAGSRVEGSVIVWNGSADVGGTIEGDLVVSNGDIHLDDDAWVEGDIVCSWNCDLEQEEGAHVDGGIVEGVPLSGFGRWRGFPVPVPPSTTSWISGPERVLGWMLGVMRGMVSILVVAAVAGLVALIWPQQMARVGRTVVEAPGPSLGIGLLTAIIALVLVVALLFTICLSPVAVLAALGLGAAGLFGWIGIGALVGERLLQALNARGIAPVWAAGLGTLLIALVSAGLSAALCLAPLGWVLVFALSCLGLGAVVLTRFGTMAYVPSTDLEHRPSHPTPPLPPVEAPQAAEPPGREAESAETKDA